MTHERGAKGYCIRGCVRVCTRFSGGVCTRVCIRFVARMACAAFICLAFAVLLDATPALAGPACHTRTGVQAALGSHGSLDAGQTRIETSSSGGLSCQRAGVVVHDKDWVRLVLDSNDGGVLRNRETGDVLPFRVYAGKDRSLPLTVGVPLELTRQSWLGTAGGVDMPLYISTQPRQGVGVAAGTYSATLFVRWFWQICPGTLAAGGCMASAGWDKSQGLMGQCLTDRICQGVQPWGAGEVAAIDVNLTVQAQCEMSTPDLSFGSAPLASEFAQARGQLRVRCTKGASYSVGMDPGRHPEGAVRRMSNGAEYLAYQLYKSNVEMDRWGHQGSERRRSNEAELNADALDGVTPQVFQYRGAILPDWPSPPAGAYVDHVVVDVQF